MGVEVAMAQTRPLPEQDEHSDEDTLSLPVWRNPTRRSGRQRRALADQVRSTLRPQRTDIRELVREDRER